MLPENHSNEDVAGQPDVFQRNTKELKIIRKPGTEHAHFSIGEIIYIQCGRRHQDVTDFICCNPLRIQVQIHTQSFIQQRSIAVCILFVPYPGHSMFGAKSFGHTAGDQIHFIVVSYGNKYVCITYFRHIQNVGGAPIALNGQYVQRIFDDLTAFIILFDYNNIIRTIGQQFGNAVTHFTCTNNNNTHKITCLSI